MKWLSLAVSVALLVLAPLGVVTAAHRVADELGRSWGSAAAQSLTAARAALGAQARTPESLVEDGVQLAEPDEAKVASEALAAPGKGSKRAVARRATPGPSGGIRVSASQVLALAQRGVMPRAVPVAASSTHPAGLKLMGVSALGVGMRDGDVLTHVASVPALSAGAVVDLVVRARARHAREISAEFWRQGARWALVVEQPYPTVAELSSPVAEGATAASKASAGPRAAP